LHQRLRERGIEIDILINNAGHGLQGPFAEAPLDAVLSMVQLDVASLTAVTHVFAQDMRTRKRGKILLVGSLLAYQGVENFAVYSAAKAYVLRLAEALHRELKRDGITVTALCPGMSDTGFAQVARQKITTLLKLVMMKPAPVVRAGIRALRAGRVSVVPGWANKAIAIFTWATPRWLHQAVMSQTMNGSRRIHRHVHGRVKPLRDSRGFMGCSRPSMSPQEITQWVKRKSGYLSRVSIAPSRSGRAMSGSLPMQACSCCARPIIAWG
jgi:hypothetical protein